MENTENGLDWVERLAQTMVQNKLHKLEFETENVSLTLRASQKPAAPAPGPLPVPATEEEEDVQEADVVLIRSKDVGLLRLVGDLQAGAEIAKGQKLGCVEAVSVEHDLVAEYTGTLVEVLVQDGDPVEYGQPLFVLSESE